MHTAQKSQIEMDIRCDKKSLHSIIKQDRKKNRHISKGVWFGLHDPATPIALILNQVIISQTTENEK